MKKLLVLVFAILIPLFAGYLIVTRSFDQKISLDQPARVTVQKGATLSLLVKQLQEENIVKNASPLKWLDKFEGPATIYAGTYEIQPGMTMRDVYNLFKEGNVVTDESQVTIIEGWNISQIAKALLDAGLISDEKAFIDAATNNMSRFKADYPLLSDLPDDASLEGYLFPDTYRFANDSTIDGIIKKMLDNLESRVDDQMRQDIAQSGKPFHEILTLASIVEKEVRSDDEMALVAGIFQNRLDSGVALQADSTVNYVTQSGHASSTLDETKIDSPYNTYKYPGLPPGPISNPGLRAIKAAISPADTDYMYFLTDNDGNVYYAKTLAEHNQNRAKYLNQ